MAARKQLVVAGGDTNASPVMFVEQTAKPRESAARSRAKVTLASTSPLAAEAARLGLQAMHRAGTTYMVHLPAGYTAGDLAPSSTAGMYRAFVHNGQGIAGHADLEKTSPVAVTALGPQLAWAVAAYVVGQHFQVEVSAKLDALQSTLDRVVESLQNDRFGTVAAAHSLAQQALALALDGRPVPASTIDLAHRDAVTVLKSQQRWLHKLEGLAADRGGREHKATDYLSAFGSLNTTVFSSELALTVAAINGVREVLRVRQLVEASMAKDPYGHYAQALDREHRDVDATGDRLTALLRLLARLPFATENKVLHWIDRNPTGEALKAQRRALELEESVHGWLLPPPADSTGVTLTVLADGRVELGPPV